jgi:hypothetical protein
MADKAIRRPRVGNILFNMAFWGTVAIGGVKVPPGRPLR